MNLNISIEEMKKNNQWPLPWTSAMGLVSEIKKLGDNIIGCELGVSYGFNLVYFLDNLPNIKIVYAIDPYLPYDDGPGGFVTTEIINRTKSLFLQNISKYHDKIKFLEKKSDDAVYDIEDNSLDYIFIDGDHSYDAVKNDIQNYYSKVRIGGIFAGHDINLVDVQKAVYQFLEEYGYDRSNLKTCANSTWYIYKK